MSYTKFNAKEARANNAKLTKQKAKSGAEEPSQSNW